MQEKERIEFLRSEIIKHDKLYEQNNPIITDTEYDKLYMELVDLEEAHPEYKDTNSPTQKIYTTVVTGLEKVKHDFPMLSQEKIKTEEEIIKFCDKANDKIICQEKLDGLTSVNTYVNGCLQLAVSRGNGEIGENITHTIRTIKNVPKKIDFEGKLVIRSEVVIPFDEFERINKNGQYSNPRNLASGTVRQLDANIAASRNLKAIAFDLVYAEGIDFNDDLEKLNFMKELGFEVVSYEVFENNEQGVNDLINHCLNYNNTVRKTLSYMIDGLVLKFNSLDVREDLGYTSKHPKWSCGYKFESLDASTILKDVVWQVGKSGQVSPVAIFDSVEIDGVNITRATLHNEEYIRDRDLKIGDKIIVVRANDVIPRVMQSIKEVRTGTEKEINIPRECPSCGSRIKKEGANLFCTGIDCRPQLEGKLQHFVSRNAMNIDGLGDKTIEILLAENIISCLEDIYTIEEKKSQIINLEGFGLKKYEKMIEGIELSKKNPLSKVIYGLSIRLVGESSSKDLAKEFGTIDAILEASLDKVSFKEKLLSIRDFGDIVSDSVVDFFSDENNRKVIRELQRLGVEMKEEISAVKLDSPIIGKTFVITGKLSKGRDEFKADIEALGGKVSGSVSKKTDYLLMGSGEEGSTKHKTALELNIKIISEEDFLTLIN